MSDLLTINDLLGQKVKITNCFLKGREGVVIDSFYPSGVQVLLNKFSTPMSFDLSEISLLSKPVSR